MGQLAKLFIRGSLVKVTAKNLAPEQKENVENLMFLVWNDPDLDSAKTEFCSILRRTISNEYMDRDYALAEVMITLWRGAVDVLYHSPKNETSEKYAIWKERKHKILTDQIIRKKYFKTYLYMYMRQIINENKIQMRQVDKIVTGPADQVALEMVEFFLNSNAPKKISYTIDEDSTIYCDTNLIPVKTLKKICILKDEFIRFNVEIKIQEDRVIINSNDPTLISKTITDKERAKFNSMSGFDEDTKNSFQQHCEYQAINRMGVDMDNVLVEDAIRAINNRLTDQSKEVFELLINPPKEFLDQFYPRRKKEVRPKELHMAQWLGISKDEVSKCINMIQKQAIALDIK